MVIETEREEKTGRNSIDEASWAATAAALLPKLERGAWIAPSLISAVSLVRNSFGRTRWAVGRGFPMVVLPALLLPTSPDVYVSGKDTRLGTDNETLGRPRPTRTLCTRGALNLEGRFR